MKYILYLTVNTINSKYYIGVHSTETPYTFDNYLGCGVYRNNPSTYKRSKTPFQYAVNKYGVDAFKRMTLAVCDDEDTAYELEELIVNEEFIKLPYVYNTNVGGLHGPDQSVKVYQYSLDGTFIKEWNSYKEVSINFGCSVTAIKTAVLGKYSSCGYIWETFYCEKLNLDNYNFKLDRHIYQYDIHGNFIKEFNNTKEIMELYNVTRSSVNSAIQGGFQLKNHYYSETKVDKYIPRPVAKVKGSKIYLYNVDGTFFKEFESATACAKYFNVKSTNGISSSLRLNRLFKGYQVSLEKVDMMKTYTARNQKKPILQYDLKGNFIKEWPSITEAKNEFGEGVARVIKGQYKTCKGFTFKLKS